LFSSLLGSKCPRRWILRRRERKRDGIKPPRSMVLMRLRQKAELVPPLLKRIFVLLLSIWIKSRAQRRGRLDCLMLRVLSPGFEPSVFLKILLW
jgi:hypothetical protein